MMVPSTRHTRPWTRLMASATVGTNFSTTARTIGQAGHETQHGKRRDIPQGTPANSSAENTCDLGRSVQPTRFRATTPLFHGSVNALCTCRTSSCICDNIRPVVR